MSTARRLVALLGALAAALLPAAPASAKTYEVTKRGDAAPGACKKRDCTLREAVLAANDRPGRDRIVLPEKKYRLSIENADPEGEDEAASGDLDVTDDLLLSHPGKGRAKVDANGIDGVFQVVEGAPTTLKRVGAVGGGGFGGAGIRSRADLTLRRSLVADNHPEFGYGGGINLQLAAGLTMVRSVVANNSVANDAGGIQGAGGPIVIKRSKLIGNETGPLTPGGALVLASESEPSRIVDSTIARNAADSFGGGIYMYGGSLSITGSTLSNNTATTYGGGIDVTGDGKLTIANSTVAENTAGDSGGGVYVEPDAEVHANPITLVRNDAILAGGGIYNGSAAAVEFANSLIALNVAPGFPDCGDDGGPGQDYDSLGHNLLSDDSDCQGFDATGDLVNSNPKLGQLKNNGGPTKTVALRKGSAAINKADKQSAPNQDQRGTKRGKKPDIGAYERVKKKKGKKRR
jgi:CSLREA domain-containing protein